MRLVFMWLFLYSHLVYANDRCDVLLKDGIVLPVVRLRVKDIRLATYDRVATWLDWRQILNRQIHVQFMGTRKMLAQQDQLLLTTQELIRRFPAVADSVDLINQNFIDNSGHKLTPAWAANRERQIRLGLGADFADFERAFPGEFGAVVLVTPESAWTSDVVSGWEQSYDPATGSGSKVTGVNFGEPFRRLQDPLIEFAGRARAERPRIQIFIVHNHPNVVAPLSPEDVRLQDHLADQFAKHYFDFDFEFYAIALGTLDAVGDVAFVRVVKP